MKKSILLFSFGFCTILSAQTSPPVIKKPLTTSSGLKINSRKGTLIEKKIYNLAKFKTLDIQKIVTKDMSDQTAESVLGIIYEYETFDNTSKKTLTIEKAELSKLIQSLQTLEQKENEGKPDQEVKYKFLTLNNIEFGGIYNEKLKSWINYIKIPSTLYNQSLNEFSKDELKELIKILKNAEQNL
ncbi:hypothetical protein [Chryseobacterium sp. OV279]|uniref:hypothetical protein n=1 Tax=Chryseobacterium sp. OV279 TaxID=1500285 RepID=UPI000917649D|nr:hypothetical protein [Chryseobacterium sp. OV279]SHF88937.1 hypothetical protein SAMN02787100_2885 [Chryseobacterium sp. OV279]